MQQQVLHHHVEEETCLESGGEAASAKIRRQRKGRTNWKEELMHNRMRGASTHSHSDVEAGIFIHFLLRHERQFASWSATWTQDPPPPPPLLLPANWQSGQFACMFGERGCVLGRYMVMEATTRPKVDRREEWEKETVIPQNWTQVHRQTED